MSSLKFRKHEKLVYELQPTPLAFLSLYTLFFLLILIGTFFLLFHVHMYQFIKSIPLISFFPSHVFLVIWIFSLIFPFLLVGVIRISWRWPLLAFLLAFAGVIMYLRTYSLTTIQWLLIIVGLFGILGVEYYRKSHHFFITNQRIITEITFFSHKRRELTFSKITDIALVQGLIGRIFNFGTIIPVTASGFGLGEDQSAFTIGGGFYKEGLITGMLITGGKSVRVPRYKSFYVIYGVKNPRKICESIAEFVHAYEEAPYLKRISDQLENITHIKD